MAMDRTEVIERIARYFVAEKGESILFVLAGLAAAIASVALVRGGGPWRGMVVPLALVGAIQLVVGTTVLLRSGAQLAAVQERVRDAPVAARREETGRMEKVMAAFRLYKAIEIVVLVAGIVLVLAFPPGVSLYAAGVGCIIQGSLMLVLDLFAEARGLGYLAVLAQIS